MASPQNTPMIIQWMTIDGQRVPVALPQYWDYTLEKWVISGDKEKEALPVQNPGTLARLESLETKLDNVIEGDAFRTQVTGNNVEGGIPVQAEKDFIEVSVNGGVLEAGKDQVYDIYSNPGEIWTLKRFGYSTSRDQTSTGTQVIAIYHGASQSANNYIMTITGNSNGFLQGTIPGSRPTYSGDISPEDYYERVETIRDTTVLSDKLPLRIRFRNQSDKEMTSRRFRLFFLVEKVNNDGE